MPKKLVFDKPLIDAYVCPNLHIMITEQICEGNTPQATNCLQCDQHAHSMRHRVNQEFRGIIEWYEPTPKEVQNILEGMDKAQQNRFKDIIQKGGLISRPKKMPTDIN